MFQREIMALFYLGILLRLSHNNTLTNNAVNSNSYGIYLDESHHNEITNKSAGNTVRNNTLYGFYLNDADDNEITCNLISHNGVKGFYLEGGSERNNVSHNNIIANGIFNSTTGGYEWNFYNDQGDSVNAAFNWWSTNVESKINASIYDYYDDTSKGKVNFTGYLSGPDPCAPIPVAGPPNITSWAPVEAIVNNTAGEPRTFNITVDQVVNVSWEINGSVVQTNKSVTEAWYTNKSAAIGCWNVSAIVENINGTDMHTWMWKVSLPDPSISSADLHFNPAHPLTGHRVNITASVHNIGGANATNVTVDFYVNGNHIGTGNISIIPASETKSASILWTAGKVGRHEILVKIDEKKLIKELNEKNNQAKRRIKVTKPLAISLTAYPEVIEANGTDSSTITAFVTDELGNGVNGTKVNFSTTLGTISPSIATTNISGIAITTLTSSTSPGTAVKVGDANVTNTTVTIRNGIITINTTEEKAPIIAANATEGSMIPVAIKNGTLEVTLSDDATYVNTTVTGPISSIKLNTFAQPYITSKPEVGTATTYLDVNFAGIFTPANLRLTLTQRDDIEYVADLVSADANMIENNILAEFKLKPTAENRSKIHVEVVDVFQKKLQY